MGRPRSVHSTVPGCAVSVSLNPEDRALIEQHAAACGMSLSGYLRAAALGRAASPSSALALVRALATANDALARVSTDVGGRVSGAGAEALARARDRLAEAAALL